MLEVVEKMTEEEIIQYNYSRASVETIGESIIDLMIDKSNVADEEKEWWKGNGKTLNRDLWAIRLLESGIRSRREDGWMQSR